jgi:ATP-dependent Lon protease
MPADRSNIVWMGTANELDLIAEPILSRFTVIDDNLPQQIENIYVSFT